MDEKSTCKLCGTKQYSGKISARCILLVIAIFFFIMLLIFLTNNSDHEKIHRGKTEFLTDYKSIKKAIAKLDKNSIHTVTTCDSLSDRIISLHEDIKSSKDGYSTIYINSIDSLISQIDSLKCSYVCITSYVDWFSGKTIRATKKTNIKRYGAIFEHDRNKRVEIASGKYRRAKALMEKHGWDKDDCIAIASGKIKIGMTYDMVIAAWGRPSDINRTTSAYGTSEQWCYGDIGGSYVYFDDGKVTTIQN